MDTIFENDFTTLSLLFGVIFTITGSLYKLFPPKKMIWYYGMQTKSARRTEETWKEANFFVASPAIIIGLLMIVLAFFPFIFESATIFKSGTAFILLFFSLMILYFITERHLAKMFDKNGNKIKWNH
ncbi:MAG: SdpI family protein [Saprospiraceae bacterium]|nr:SdpI family protein [Saprospiraceae bacterium]